MVAPAPAEGTPVATTTLVSSALETWQEDAACRGRDLDLFFSRDDDNRDRAVELCLSCPVQEQCLSFALEHGEMHGIWGGMGGTERRSHIRERRRRERDAA